MMQLTDSYAAYLGMCADPLHHGHINVIEFAQSLHRIGSVMVGLLTDEAIASYKQPPIMKYEDRLRVVSSLKGVDKVVPQTTLDYVPNLLKYRPRYVVHGGRLQESTRAGVIKALATWGAELIEIPYTEGISSTKLRDTVTKEGITPGDRERKLRRLIGLKPIVRVMEAHNGLSGLIVENTRVDVDGDRREFDAIWESSLTDSASKGKPDTELVDFTSRLQTIEQILEVTTKPLIVDGDTGGHADHFAYAVKTLERLGVSAVIIEDKKFPKQNSLLEGGRHELEDTEIFWNKLRAGKDAQITEGIMIHSKKKDADEILEFCKQYRKIGVSTPLFVVPTTYNTITEQELIDVGVSAVIYANHLLRSSYAMMKHTAKVILDAQKASVVEPYCVPVAKLFEVVK